MLSALEGLELLTPVFTPYILPATIVILISLFWAQSHGTARVASLFGPIMAVFSSPSACLARLDIHDSPRILLAFDPIYGLQFLLSHGLIGFVVLGSGVPLRHRGRGALYADMGHFGRLPIQAWRGSSSCCPR